MLNSVNLTQAPYNLTPVANQSLRPRQGVFYAFDQELAVPPLPAKPEKIGVFNWFFHPLESYQLSKKLGINEQGREPFGVRLAMYRTLKKNLSSHGRNYLWQQLKQGHLTDIKADDNRSTIAHLYSIVTTARAPGVKAAEVLEETLRLMTQPQTITQKFGTLKEQSLQAMDLYYKSRLGPKTKEPVTANTLRVSNSATCVASSVMYYMASKCPSEFARHISELTSPRLAFMEKAWMNEISPEDPSKAAQKLAEYGIPATAIPGTNGAQYWVKVNLPYSGLVWAVNQQGNHEKGTRGVVESAYQAALTHLAAQSYDPGFDMRVNDDGSLEYDKGLEEERKTLMESIIKDNGGVMSVTYQLTAGGRDNEPYLMGYFRNFDQTRKDLMQAIDMGETVLIGITDTDKAGTTGRLDMKHELTVTGYEKDRKTGELMFTIADSDDDNPNLVKRSARELIPMIHHAGYPVKLAQKIWGEINGKLNNQYLLPDQQDAANYKLIATVPPSNQKAFLEDYQRMTQEEEAAAQPQQQVAQQQPAKPTYQPATPYYAYPGSYYNAYYPQQQTAYAYSYPSYGYYGNPWARTA